MYTLWEPSHSEIAPVKPGGLSGPKRAQIAPNSACWDGWRREPKWSGRERGLVSPTPETFNPAVQGHQSRTTRRLRSPVPEDKKTEAPRVAGRSWTILT